jgi:homoserine O-acetyltransferase/O-succinyltransferase
MTIITPIGDLPLTSGATLRDAALAHVSYGQLAADGRNAILLTHGYTSSHLFGGSTEGASEGTWSALVGAGKAIDTNRYFVVSSNMLGSSFGSTAPKSHNPATGRAYGPDFPAIGLTDIVTAQRRLLDALGVKHLAAVVGPSYGGFQAFAWGVTFPDFVDCLVPAVTGLKSPNSLDMDALEARMSRDPNWNGGHYYERGGILATMTRIRAETLRNYGIETALAARFPDAAARHAEIEGQARAWAEAFDAHALLVLGRASNAYDVTPLAGRIRAKVLYVLSRTDKLFPPSLAPGVMATLREGGVDAHYFEIDSDDGHLASGTAAHKWAPTLKAFLEAR